jgi:ABC-2 type transport system permease protein
MNFRVLKALWYRQILRYVRSRARMIGSLGQPLLFLLALGFGFGPVYKRAGGGDFIQFLVPGVVAMGALFTAMFSGIEVIFDKQFGFLKETLVAPVSRFEIMLGRTLGGATVATLQGVLVLLISFGAGFRPADLSLLPLGLIFLFLIALLFTALGTALASKLEDMQGFQLIMNFLVMPIFFLSGALFPSDGLPDVMKNVMRLDPLFYGVDGLRGCLTGHSDLSLGLDCLVMAVLAGLCLALGAKLFSKIQI